MTDKVQLIKEEIERRIENLKISLDKNCITEESKLDIRGNITTLYGLLEFIDSLPEEPASKDLDSIVISLEETIGTSPHSREVIKEHLQKAAEWQKQQMNEALQTEYEKGRFDMREELMKDAVECTIKYEIGSAEIPQCDRRYQVLSDQVHIANAKLGDKVKIIILKTE